MTSFLQSEHWRTFQETLGRTTYTNQGDGWSYLAIKESGTFNTRLYTPYGPTCHDSKSFDSALASLRTLGIEQKATFFRVEPPVGISTDQLRQRGLMPVTYQQLQPSHTQIIDLSPSIDEILAAMSQNSRNVTRNYHKKGIAVRTSREPNDISILTDLIDKVATRNHITLHSQTYFQTQATVLFPRDAATLYIAEYHSTPIAAALVYDYDGTRTYAHAAADNAYRKLNAGTALVGQLIIDAKTAGLQRVDLYGTTDSDDPKHPWAGFTKFKKSFGGTALAYPGAWDVPLRPFGYTVYRAYQTLRRKLR